MKEILVNNIYFGVFITLFAFKIADIIFKKFKLAILNPFLISLSIIFAIMTTFNISVEEYSIGGDVLGFFIGPATVCLALPLYKELDNLKKYYKIILIGGFIGSVTAVISVVTLGRILRLEESILLSLVPKSITTPIGLELSRVIGGILPITAFSITMTGVCGNIIAPYIIKIFKIKNPIARGLGIGISSHAVGTAKALEIGETEGAISALSIVIAGITTIFIAPFILMMLKFF